MVILAHGVCAALAFVILFPTGGIIIRVLSFPGLIWLHAAIQALSYLIFIAAAGLGIYFATQTRQIHKAHPIIGLVLLVVIFFQPILGLLHHFLFKRHARRVVWSYGHIWLGRIIITLGIINGGLGLQLANDASRGQIIAYAVVAAIMWLAYVASAVYGEIKRKRHNKPVGPAAVEKGHRMDNLSGSERSLNGSGDNQNHMSGGGGARYA